MSLPGWEARAAGVVDGLVGRGGDLAAVDAAAASDSGQVVLVAGEPGVGKTRLLEEIVARRVASGARPAWGRCSPDPAAPELWPVAQVVAALTEAADVGARGTGIGGLEHLLALGQGRPSEAPATPSNRYAVAEAVVDLVRTAASQRPLALLVDDVQWADASSLTLLDFVARATGDLPVLLVLAHRDLPLDEEVEAGLDRLRPLALHIRLDGLDEADTAQLVADRTGVDPPDDALRRLHGITGGNPLFIEQYLRLIAAGEDPAGATAVPATVVDAVSRRLRASGPEAVDLLRVAAVAGPEFSVAVVAHALGRPVAAVAPVVDELCRRRLLSTAAGAPAGRCAFAHAVVRDAALADVEGPALARLHAAVAAALAAAAAPPGEQAAHALAAVPEVPAAVAADLARVAGADAVARLAYVEAAGWYQQALDLLYRDPAGTEDDRLTVLLDLGEAQMRGGVRGAAETFERARRLARAAGRPVELARAAAGASASRYRGPGWETQLIADRPLLEEAVAALEAAPDGDPVVLARLLGELAACHALDGERVDAIRCADRAVQAAAGTDDVAARQAALVGRRWSLLGPGPSVGGPEVTEQLRLLAVQTGDLEGRWRAARWAFHEALEAGDPEGLGAALAVTEELAERLGEPALRVDALVQQGTVALLEGRWDDLAALHERASELAASAEVGTEAILGQQLFASRERGELQVDVLRLILEANAHALYHGLVCWGSAAAGPSDALVRDVERFFAATDVDALVDGTHLLPVLAMVTEAVAELGDADRAAVLRRRLAPYRGQCVVAGVGPYVWTGAVDHYLGLLDGALGEVAAAEADFATAEAVHARMGAPPWVLRTRLARARVVPTSRAALEELADDADRLGMVVVAAGARALLDAVPAQATPTDVGADEGPWRLGRDGTTWLVTGARSSFRLVDRKGLRALSALLARPHHEIHVLELAAAVDGAAAARGGDLGPVLDAEAKRSIRRRVGELQEDIDEAEAFGDPERGARARAELDALLDGLSAAVGLGGRDRPTGSAAERARVNLTRSIRSALDAIAEHHPVAARALAADVRTGIYCAYEPGPASPVRWEA